MFRWLRGKRTWLPKVFQTESIEIDDIDSHVNPFAELEKGSNEKYIFKYINLIIKPRLSHFRPTVILKSKTPKNVM